MVGVVPGRDHLARLHHAGLDHAEEGRRRFREKIDLATLQREPRRVVVAIAGDVAIRQTQHVELEADEDVLGGIRSEAAGHEALGGQDVGRILDAGLDVGSNVIDGIAGLRADELVALQVDPKPCGIADVGPGRGGDIAEHGAVLRTKLADEARTHHAAGAVLVLHDDAGVPIDVLDKMPGEQPSLDVAGSAGGEVDHEIEPLALVEGIVGSGDGYVDADDGAKPDDGGARE